MRHPFAFGAPARRGPAPFGVAVEGAHVFVVNSGSGSVKILDGSNAFVASVPVGLFPLVFGAFATAGPLQYALELTTVGAGSITAQPAPVAGTYAAGTVVALTATPATGSQFSGWSGACSGSAACIVTMDAAKSVTASFAVTLPPPPPVPAPTTCEDKIKDLQKKVAGYKRGWWHNYDLSMALRMYSEALAKLDKAKAKVGELDRRFLHAQKELNNGKAALCTGRYRRAHHDFWEAYEIAQRILRHSHYRR